MKRKYLLVLVHHIAGRYDDMKSAAENIDFQTTILSRFDLIFIVRDKQSIQRDVNLAKHIIGVHKLRDQAPLKSVYLFFVLAYVSLSGSLLLYH